MDKSRVSIYVGAVIILMMNLFFFQNCSVRPFQAVDQVPFYQAANGSTNSPSEAPPQDLPPEQLPPTAKNPDDILICPSIICAAPPENCSYQIDPVNLDLNGNLKTCPSNCGKLVCNIDKPKLCPMLSCAAPPMGCAYKGNNIVDGDGCAASCGQLVCGADDLIDSNPGDGVQEVENPSLSIFKGSACPKIGFICVLPTGSDCHYDQETAFDKNGCQTGCGKLVCP